MLGPALGNHFGGAAAYQNNTATIISSGFVSENLWSGNKVRKKCREKLKVRKKVRKTSQEKMLLRSGTCQSKDKSGNAVKAREKRLRSGKRAGTNVKVRKKVRNTNLGNMVEVKQSQEKGEGQKESRKKVRSDKRSGEKYGKKVRKKVRQ